MQVILFTLVVLSGWSFQRCQTTTFLNPPNSLGGINGSKVADKAVCPVIGTWGQECTKSCRYGCPGIGACDMVTGACLNGQGVPDTSLTCLDGYEGDNCEKPICPEGCEPGICVAPNLCQLCPMHYASGPTCRNLRLDGLLKGSLPAMAILVAIVLILSFVSEWHIKSKVKIS